MSEHKMRVSWNSNAMWSPSGYSNQSRQILPLMAKEGYKVAAINFYGQEGGVFELEGIMQYPKISDLYGADAMIEHSKRWKSDVVFTLQDIWTIPPDAFRAIMQLGMRWVPYVPIDHDPIPPAIFERLKLAYRVVTMSPFGYRELKRLGMHSTCIPHMVNTELFRKYENRDVLRSNMKIPNDVFLFGVVAANKDNPPRKSLDKIMDAFKIIHDKYPNTALYFHTQTRQAGGFDIDNYAKFLGLEDCIYRGDPYEMMYMLTQEDMGKVYNTFDCFVLPSQNEGFGIPVIEAQACEIPVITTDFTAMTDLVIEGETGFKLPVTSKRYTPLNSYVANIDVPVLADRMERVYNMSPEKRAKMGANGRKFILENFSQEKIWNKDWMPFLQRLEDEAYPRN